MLELHARLLHAAAQLVGNVFHHAAHVDCLERQGFGSLFRFRYQCHVAYEVGEAHGLRVGFPQEVFLTLFVQPRTFHNRFQISANAAYRRAQLVRDVVAHLLLEFLGLLGLRGVGERQFETLVAVNQHLHGEARTAGLYRVAEERRFLHGAAAVYVLFEELANGLEAVVAPKRVEVGRGTVENRVGVLRELGVGKYFLPVGRKDGDACFRIEEVAQEAFALQGDLPVALVELPVFQGERCRHVAQFAVGKLQLIVVHQPPVGGTDEEAQLGYGLAEVVGDINQQHEHYGEEHQRKPQKHVVGFHEVANLVVVRQCHAHDEAAVGLGEIEKFLAFGDGGAYVAAFVLVEREAHLGAVVVVAHLVGHHAVALVYHRAILADDREAQFFRQQQLHLFEFFHGGCAVQPVCFNIARHEVGITQKPRFEQLAPILPLAIVLETYEQQCKGCEKQREVQQQFAAIRKHHFLVNE